MHAARELDAKLAKAGISADIVQQSSLIELIGHVPREVAKILRAGARFGARSTESPRDENDGWRVHQTRDLSTGDGAARRFTKGIAQQLAETAHRSKIARFSLSQAVELDRSSRSQRRQLGVIRPETAGKHFGGGECHRRVGIAFC